MNFRKTYSIVHRDIFHTLTSVSNTVILSQGLQWVIVSDQSDAGVPIQSPKVQLFEERVSKTV